MRSGAAPSPTAGAEFLAEARHYLAVEYRTKISHLLDALPPDALWARPAEGSNAIGNLLLHLAGNVRQWIVAGIGGAAFDRDRTAEFAATHGDPAPTLLAHLDAALRDADAVLAQLNPDDLLTPRRIQSRDVTVLSAIFHVVEHFAMHTGQMITLAKAAAPGRVRFYADQAAGQATALWLSDLRPVPGAGAAGEGGAS
jgi:uncharacterized damage-inducible protein DinB